MHHDRSEASLCDPLARDAPLACVFAQAGQEAGVHPFPLDAKGHDDVGIAQGLAEIVRHGDGARCGDPLGAQPGVDGVGKPDGEQGWRRAQDDVCAKRGEPPGGRPCHAAVQDVADDRNAATLDGSEAGLDGEEVEECLCGVRVPAIAGVDDGCLKLACDEVRCA